MVKSLLLVFCQTMFSCHLRPQERSSKEVLNFSKLGVYIRMRVDLRDENFGSLKHAFSAS